MKRELVYKEFSHNPNAEYMRYCLPKGYLAIIEGGDIYDRAIFYNPDGVAVAAEYGILYPAGYIEMLENNGAEVVKQIMEEGIGVKLHAVK